MILALPASSMTVGICPARQAIFIGHRPPEFLMWTPALLARIPAGMSLEMRSALTPQEAQPARPLSNFLPMDALYQAAPSSLRPYMERKAIWGETSSAAQLSEIGTSPCRKSSNSMNEFPCNFAEKYSTS